MKNIIYIIALLLLSTSLTIAQETQEQAQEQSDQPLTSIAKSLGLFVFPSNNQTPEQQDQDEMACFKWAKEQTGYDPLNPTKVAPEQVKTGPDGSAVVGAAKGAAAGAAIGAIAGDAGEGAAIGAVVGGLAGRRARRVNQQQQQEQSKASAEAQNQAMLDEYKKAFSACMEGKGYTVK